MYHIDYIFSHKSFVDNLVGFSIGELKWFVIIGNDLIVRNGEVLVNPDARSKMDKTENGRISGMRNNPEY